MSYPAHEMALSLNDRAWANDSGQFLVGAAGRGTSPVTESRQWQSGSELVYTVGLDDLDFS
jgi:hypothetical protein